jgi:hypothetical protein
MKNAKIVWVGKWSNGESCKKKIRSRGDQLAKTISKEGSTWWKKWHEKSGYEEDYLKTRIQKPIRSFHTLRVPIPSLVEEKGLKWASMSDILHILVELEYMMPPIFNFESYYAIFRLQTCIKVRIAPPMIRAQVSEQRFFCHVGNRWYRVQKVLGV